MLASTSEGYDLGLVLLDLLIVLFAAKLAAELAERLQVPAVLGEIVAGIIIGPSVLGLVDPLEHTDVASMLVLLGEIGVILLLLQVGMEMDLAEMGQVGRSSLLVAVIGVAAPFIAGFAVALAFGEEPKISIFIGAALTATSVGITARVFGDLKALSSNESRIVLGAAVADDVLGLVILTVVVKIVTEGSVGFGTVFSTIAIALVFLMATGLAAVFVVPRLFDVINRWSKAGTTLVVAAFCLMLLFAELANAAKLAFIIGAFMAGLALGRTRYHERIADNFNPLGHIFIPIFFATIGINADLEAMAKPEVLGLAAVLTVVAVLGKLASAFGALGTPADKLLVGMGMVPRGEVGLIFAAIGLSRGVLDDDLYGAVLIVVLVTTLMTPPLLRWRLARPQSAGAPAEAIGQEPPEGWLTIEDDEVVLHGTPPSTMVVPLALRAAALVGAARPSDRLVRWLSDPAHDPLSWRSSNTDALLPLLRHSDPRTWRLLEVTNVLERTLPEVAEAVHRRRSDPTELDPTRPLRFPTVDQIATLADNPGRDPAFDRERAALERPNLLTLAGFVHDVVATTGDPAAATSLAARLSPADADTITAALRGADELLDATRTTGVFDPERIARLASELTSPDVARLSYLLAVVRNGDPRWRREMLDEIFESVRSALA